jgi:hypothetical protein
VRPSPPRFLNSGDTLELPVVVHNATDRPLTVDVGVRADNLALSGTPGRRVQVPARDRIELRFPAAAGHPGTARFQVAAVSGSMRDGAQLELPVLTPTTSEDFATYGVLDAGTAVQPVAAPTGALPNYGGLAITTSSTELQSLTDAVLYLQHYPFACSEQLASRMLAINALRDVIGAFAGTGAPSAAEIDATTAADLAILGERQLDDGGFGLWTNRNDEWPFFSVHVTHALVRAKVRGVAVDERVLSRALDHLTRVDTAVPRAYPPAARHVIASYALYVRHLAGRSDPAAARALLQSAGGANELPLEAVGWLLATVARDPGSRATVAELLRFVESRASETAGTATFANSVGKGAHLVVSSARRTDAAVLEALIEADPNNTLIPKLVRGLLAGRVRGRWISTQENVFILLALARYFDVFEKTPPAFTARAWLGTRFVGEQAFAGRKTERYRIDVPQAQLSKTAEDLTLSKVGAGRLYYRIAMTYAPAGRSVPAALHGFAVRRSYQGVDDPADVRRGADGVWVIRAGARVRVRIDMVATALRHHVALVDWLPAGLEAEDPDLVKRRRRVSRGWYEHRAFLDARVEAFSTRLDGGEYALEYIATATTPGTFVAPPARAEEMYAPETFGRSASDVVRVEAR